MPTLDWFGKFAVVNSRRKVPKRLLNYASAKYAHNLRCGISLIAGVTEGIARV